jgi:predicted DsbA family dithiol-disulfide isomerase
MNTVQIFTDFVCPWCYLNTARVAKLKTDHGLDVQWRYFPLHPETPPEGLSLERLFAGRNFDLKAANARLKMLMDAEGLPYTNDRTHTYNSRLAQELAKWADTQPGHEGIHDALYRAYFVDNRNLFDIDLLAGIAEFAGLSADDARIVLTERTFKEAVDADWVDARRYGITGVPSFVAGRQKIAGAQPYEVLEDFLQTAGMINR